MSHEKIKNLFAEAVASVSSDISSYVIHPEKDFTRNKKLPSDKFISFMVSCGSSSTKIELLDLFKDVLYCSIFKFSSEAINISFARSIRYWANSFKLPSTIRHLPSLYSYKTEEHLPTYPYWLFQYLR